MIIEGVKHISYNILKQELRVVYSNGDEKIIPMSEQEYENMLSKGDFNFLKQNG